MRKLLLFVGSWLHWIAAKLVDALFRIITLALMAIILVVACMYVIDYAYERSMAPCVADNYHYKAVIERKLWKSGEQEDKLYLIRLELTKDEVMTAYKAWVTPEQYAEMTGDEVILNVTETKGGGLIIAEWGVTIEEF